MCIRDSAHTCRANVAIHFPSTSAAATLRAFIEEFVMTQQYPPFIWHNGSIKPWADATTHVMAHALHYGSSVFEGIRSYPTPKGQAIFRLTDHLKRLYHSAKIYDMPIPYTLDELAKASRDVIKANKLDRAYLRPVAFRGLGGFGLSAETPTDVAVAAWEMGPYLGDGCLLYTSDAADDLTR